MRQVVLILLFGLLSVAGFGQTKDSISVSFSGDSIESAIEKIESASGYRFYFDERWFDKTVTLSNSYTLQPVRIIIADILKSTDLNFFVQDNAIILTRNTLIFDKVAENYFDERTDETTPTEIPTYQSEYVGVDESSEDLGVTAIGKQTRNKSKATYVISGRIVNKKTGEPIPGISIFAAQHNAGAITDEDGQYRLELPAGANTIKIEALNFRSVKKNVMLYDSGSLNMSLTETSNQLEEVVVKGQTTQTKRAEGGVTTISAEAVKTIPLVLGERDILKVATIMPGIKTVGEGSAGYNVRGGKEDQNLILLDQAVLYNPAHFLGFFSAVNPYTTDKATIYKGSIPAEYGGRLSAVFDIESKKPNVEKISGEGGVGPVTSNLALNVPIVKDKAGLMVGGRATYSGWILRSLDEEQLKNSEASFYDVIAKYQHRINENNSFEGTFYYSRDAFSITSDSLYKYSNRLMSLKWSHKFNEKNNASFFLTNSEYRFNIEFQSPTPRAFDFGYQVNETQFIAKLGYRLSEKHNLNYGLMVKSYNISPGKLEPTRENSPLIPIDIPVEKAVESAVYLADSYKISEKFLIDVGLRYSLFAALGESVQRLYQPDAPLSDATVIGEREFGNNEVIKRYGGLEPRIAARYLFRDDFSIKAGYDKTYQYIHLLSSNTTQSPTDTWKLSDLNVEPQVSQQFSLGLYKEFANGIYEASIEGYYKHSENILDYKVGAELLMNQNIETELLQGKGRAYGVELMLRKTEGRLNGWIGYTYSRALLQLDGKFNEERVNNGNFFPSNFDKPHDVSVVANYKFTKRYSASANFIYQTGRPITYPIGTYNYGNAQYTLYSDRNQYRIPDYFRLDIGFNIEGNHKIKKLAHSFWNISVYNVLGRNNPYSVFFVTEEGKIKAYKTSIFAIPVPTVTYNFKF